MPTPMATASAPSVHAERRRRLGDRIGDAALVLHAGALQTRSNDTEHRFRPNSDFYYLTGLAEPGALLVLRPRREPRFTLFLPPQDDRDALYNGRRPGPDAVRERVGADAAHPMAELATTLPKLLAGLDSVYVPFAGSPAADRAVRDAIEALRANERGGDVAPECLRDAR